VFAASVTQLATKIDQIMLSRGRGQGVICSNLDHRRESSLARRLGKPQS
jgi:hypothetical protein